ncbi:MarR family transcriptional regulator [Actinoplanes sp. NPDC051633]|uniref:MarR family winged helix-turn-helix transcriptional regulator n=1 Tax=Actinoplanes sp. NPDC051633 TaxID=3155670 RepID=UPI00341EA14A
MTVERLLAAQQRAAARGTVLAELIAARLGIAPTDLKSVFLLAQGPRSARVLADELRLTPSAVTAVIDRLERAGFAVRERSSADRRQVTVRAVPERVAEATALYRPLYEQMAELVGGYTDDQVMLLLDFAQRSDEILAEVIGRVGHGDPPGGGLVSRA